MLKKILLGGITASAIGFHFVNDKQTKETLTKYCPAFTNCCQNKTKTKNKNKNNE